MLRHVIVAAFAVAAVVPAAAQDSPGAKPAKEKKVCKREVSTGSVMPKVTCHTKAEWDAIASKSQNDMDRTRELERSRGNVNISR